MLKYVTRWDKPEPVIQDQITWLKRELLWDANRIILGTMRSEVDPLDPPETDPVTAVDLLVKSGEHTS
jgi:hypothetical protein